MFFFVFIAPTQAQTVSKTEKKAGDLTERVRDPERRAELLKANPEADVNKDGMLTLEEAWAFLKKEKAARQLLPVGAAAPDWTLKDSRAKPHRLSDYRGKIVVMDFWAVWCIPCHLAMPGLQKLHNDLSRRGVAVLGISTNEHGGDQVQLMKDRGYTYKLLLNGETISEAYGVVGMPTIYVLGADGRIIHSGFGANKTAEQRRRTFIEGYLTEHGKWELVRISILRCFYRTPPNEQVQQRGRQERHHTAESRVAGPVRCNGFVGPETVNVPNTTLFSDLAPPNRAWYSCHFVLFT